MYRITKKMRTEEKKTEEIKEVTDSIATKYEEVSFSGKTRTTINIETLRKYASIVAKTSTKGIKMLDVAGFKGELGVIGDKTNTELTTVINRIAKNKEIHLKAVTDENHSLFLLG